jgi:protein involved in polysaccharide export with SLBB domain
MARFGKSFVQAATQPAFTQGLFTAARQIGAAPAQQKAGQTKTQILTGLFGLQQQALADELSPEELKVESTKYMQIAQKNPDMASDILQSLSRVGTLVRNNDKNQAQLYVNNTMSRIQSEYTRLFSDASMSTADRDAKARALRDQATALKEANPKVDFSKFANWDSQAMNAGMGIKTRIKNEEATAEQDNIDAKLRGMTAEERDRFVETYDGPESQYLLTRANNLNTYDERTRKRQEEAENRKQDLTTDINNIENSLESLNLPAGLKKEIQRDLEIVRAQQTKGKSADGRWKSVALQNQANKLLARIDSRIDTFTDGLERSNLRAQQEIGAKIAVLEEQLDSPNITQAKLIQYAKLIATQSGERRPFDEISEKKKAGFITEAREVLTREHNEKVEAELRTQRALQKYLLGNDAEETSEAPTEDFSRFSTIVDEAVADNTGRSRAEVIEALKKRGDIPKGYMEQSSEKTESLEKAIEVSEKDLISSLFGEQGYVVPLGLDTKNVSLAIAQDRVYYLLETTGDLSRVTTADLELLQYDENKHTPRIKAELKRRGQ